MSIADVIVGRRTDGAKSARANPPTAKSERTRASQLLKRRLNGMSWHENKTMRISVVASELASSQSSLYRILNETLALVPSHIMKRLELWAEAERTKALALLGELNELEDDEARRAAVVALQTGDAIAVEIETLAKARATTKESGA